MSLVDLILGFCFVLLVSLCLITILNGGWLFCWFGFAAIRLLWLFDFGFDFCCGILCT